MYVVRKSLNVDERRLEPVSPAVTPGEPGAVFRPPVEIEEADTVTVEVQIHRDRRFLCAEMFEEGLKSRSDIVPDDDVILESKPLEWCKESREREKR